MKRLFFELISNFNFLFFSRWKNSFPVWLYTLFKSFGNGISLPPYLKMWFLIKSACTGLVKGKLSASSQRNYVHRVLQILQWTYHLEPLHSAKLVFALSPVMTAHLLIRLNKTNSQYTKDHCHILFLQRHNSSKDILSHLHHFIKKRVQSRSDLKVKKAKAGTLFKLL